MVSLVADSEVSRHVVGPGNRHQARQCLPKRGQVLGGEFVLLPRNSPAALQRSIGDVGANALNLFADVLFACGNNGDHQHDGRTANDHAKHGERSLQLIYAERPQSELYSLSPMHTVSDFKVVAGWSAKSCRRSHVRRVPYLFPPAFSASVLPIRT